MNKMSEINHIKMPKDLVIHKMVNILCSLGIWAIFIRKKNALEKIGSRSQFCIEVFRPEVRIKSTPENT